MDSEAIEREKRRLIRQTQTDQSLTGSQKAFRTRLFMSGQNYEEVLKHEETEMARQQREKEEAEKKREWLPPTEKDNEEMGCSHYPLGLKVRAACCGQFFPCRVCHDETVTDHKIDRHAVTEMLCMHCNKLQPVAKDCKYCGKDLGRYYCDICKFHDDTPNRDIFHCADCGICRRGERNFCEHLLTLFTGKTDEYFHCQVCNMCMSVSKRGGHTCVPNTMKNDCVVCGLDLFQSRAAVEVLSCGHLLHSKCFKQMINSYHFACPICKKSMMDMSRAWRTMDLEVASQPMPREFVDAKQKMLCNDCGEKAEVNFHFVGLKCPKCNGYNTSALERTGRWPTQEEMISASEQITAMRMRRRAEAVPVEVTNIETMLLQDAEAQEELNDDEMQDEEEDEDGEMIAWSPSDEESDEDDSTAN
ncbi:CHY and CTCHY and RING-type zinc finger protein [Planoprotostelium fungivorum]|uniref:CHY and CTCHY and RING-type zinc finger protein n=1 Tax=Planoprotostelium fungivorum TaxID=1890364 RepID=A0A2P6N9E2_9EUKA|nr:CHY and CTCHY and RING-type zinc finger protein [Planoprotostelium fungivorum]